MEKKNKVVVSFFIIIALVAGLYVFSGWFSRTTGYIVGEDQDDSLAKCMTQKGVVLYTTDSCPECKRQKSLFGASSYKYIDKIDCSYERPLCLNLQLLPAWSINSEFYYGVKSTEELRVLSGCGGV